MKRFVIEHRRVQPEVWFAVPALEAGIHGWYAHDWENAIRFDTREDALFHVMLHGELVEDQPDNTWHEV